MGKPLKMCLPRSYQHLFWSMRSLFVLVYEELTLLLQETIQKRFHYRVAKDIEKEILLEFLIG